MIGAAMRIVKVGVLAPTNKGIPLGVQGENSATQVEFDTRPWFREYPSGTVSAVARRDGDPAPYPLTLDVADGTAVWQVSDTDTAKAGEGAVELTMTSAGARVRSLTFKTLVTASLTDSPVDDDAWYGWLDKAVVKVDETVQSAQRKMAEVDDEWTGLKADVTAKVDECGKVAAQAAQDAHHAKVDAQATAKALESAEGSVAKAEAAANHAVNASIAADDSAAEASRSALSAVESADAAAGSAANAAMSASEAATSASNAADAASAASGSASAAAQSATDASNAKDAAQTAKAGAEAAKGEAATSASNAAESATAAAKSASDAAASVGAINVIAPKSVEVAALSEVDGSVAVGAGSVAKKSNELSIGNDTLTREITHVSTPIDDTSAATKKYTDDNDANTLSEAKKYTDTNTSNALVGTASGKLLHVEDAWPSPLMSVTIDGAYKQDGTPSPEAPVQITVIENAVLTICGRNVFKTLSDLSQLTHNGITFTPTGNGGFRITGSSTGASFYNLDFSYDVNTSITYLIGQKLFHNTVFFYPGYTGIDGGENNIKNGETLQNDAVTWRSFFYVEPGNTVDDVLYPYVTIGKDDGYAPYTSSTLPITLPAEHPYLAALPDGTHDEIVIDKDGNATLVARVVRITLSEFAHSPLNECIDIYEIANVNNRVSGFRLTNFSNPNTRSVVCSELPSLHDSWNTAKIGVDWIDGLICRYSWDVLGIVDGDSISVRIEKLKEYAQNKVDAQLYYPINTTVTYQLGKLDIPSLPETISNVWTDAELTTNMSMTYKRDINVAFDNLVQAVVASAAGE